MLPLPLALPLPQQGTALGRSSTCQDGQAWQLCWSTSWFYRIAPKFYCFMVGRNRNYTQCLFLAIFLLSFSCFLVLPLQMGKEEIGQATCTEQPPMFVYIKIIQKKKMSQWKIISKRAQTFLFPLRLGQQLHLWESPCHKEQMQGAGTSAALPSETHPSGCSPPAGYWEMLQQSARPWCSCLPPVKRDLDLLWLCSAAVGRSLV